jgi:hypothetical protein
MYDANMEIDIAADANTIRRTKGCISFIYPDLIGFTIMKRHIH